MGGAPSTHADSSPASSQRGAGDDSRVVATETVALGAAAKALGSARAEAGLTRAGGVAEAAVLEVGVVVLHVVLPDE